MKGMNRQWMWVAGLLVCLGLLVTSCVPVAPTAAPVAATSPAAPAAAASPLPAAATDAPAAAATPVAPASPPLTPAAAAKEGEPYVVGFLAAVTGSSSFLGAPERDAALMLKKQIEAQGITGADGIHHSVTIVIYDTEGKGDTAIPLAKKLINDDKAVVIVGGTASAESLALVPIVQEAKIPYISMASSSQIVEPAKDHYWVFKTAQSNKHTAPWQVRYAKAKGATKLANLYVNNAYGEDGRDAIREAAKAEGVDIILEEKFEATDTDVTAQLTKVRASGAQALLVTGLPPAASILTKQFRELGLTIPLIHNHGIGMKPFITSAGADNAEGVIFPMGKLVAAKTLDDKDPQKPVLLQFMKDYEASSGNPASTFAGHAWDGLNIVFNGLKTLPSGLSLEDQRARLRDAIESTKGFAGISGIFNLSADDHVGMSPQDIVIARITKGDWEYLPPDRW
jgi:branched-chain amino acid transport system substrate-binding protein